MRIVPPCKVTIPIVNTNALSDGNSGSLYALKGACSGRRFLDLAARFTTDNQDQG
jgi:hypothetical protein